MTFTTMRPDDFETARALLPPDLAGRAQRLRACATRAYGCTCCRIARRALRLCFEAAAAGRERLAGDLLAEAEHYVDAGAHRASCPQLPPQPKRPVKASPWQGRVAGFTGGGPLVAATDAAWKRGTGGLGYVVGDGRWGMRGWRPAPQDPTGKSKVLVSELRAVALLLDRLENDRLENDRVANDRVLLLMMDSLYALRFLRAWQRGDVSYMPHGYDLRPRRHGRPPTLVRLAERVAARPAALRTAHVKAHSGHPLNEIADSLASMARRRTAGEPVPLSRAESLVEAFLHTWHDAPAPALGTTAAAA
ncbi:ribonuclease HI [Actinomadura sp. 21ATH]|uniref:ribonuclease HI n=1 Tax=Actinomadura sp. 21ATH TaxID=1735444 RepID=UPI0035BFD913